MLRGVTKEKLKVMYESCKYLGQLGFSEEVGMRYDCESLTMIVWRWGEIHLQVSRFDDYKPNENDKLVREGKPVLGLTWQITNFKSGGYAYICDMNEAEFLAEVSDA